MSSELDLYHKAKAAYYSGEPIMSDQEFDNLESRLFPLGDAPIGAPVLYGSDILLPYNPASLMKMASESKTEINQLIGRATQFICMEKLNGVSAIYWKDDEGQKHLSTKGDGKSGSNISELIKLFNLPDIESGVIYRGELIFPLSVKHEYTNNLTAVNACIKRKNLEDADQDLLGKLDFVLYEIFPLIGTETYSIDVQVKMMRNFIKKTKNVSIVQMITSPYVRGESLDLSNILKKMRHDSKYDIDGIVVTNGAPNDISNVYPNKSPKYKLAFKEVKDSSMAETEVIGIQVKQSKKGQLVPVLLIKPIILDGKTIKKVSSGGIDNMQRNKIGIGAIIVVKLGGEVIPAIHFVKHGVDFDPKSIDLTVDKDAQFVLQCASFFKKCGCKGVGPKLIEEICKSCEINNIFDILSMDDFSFLSGKKNALMCNQIEIVKDNVSMIIICSEFSLFGPGISKSIIGKLFEKYPNFFDSDFDYEEIGDIKGVATKLDTIKENCETVAELIRENLSEDEIDMYMERNEI